MLFVCHAGVFVESIELHGFLPVFVLGSVSSHRFPLDSCLCLQNRIRNLLGNRTKNKIGKILENLTLKKDFFKKKENVISPFEIEGVKRTILQLFSETHC